MQTTPVQHPAKHILHITAVQTTGHLGCWAQTRCQKGKEAVLTLARALSGTISQGGPPSSPMQLGVAGRENLSEENSSKNDQNGLTAWQHRHQKQTQTHALIPAHTLLQGQHLSHNSLRPSTPLGWASGPTNMSCSRTTVLQSHSIQQESQNHHGRFCTSAGNPCHMCSTWAKWFPAKGQVQLRFSLSLGRSKELISVGQYLTSKLFTQTHCPLLCGPHTCSAVATHTACSPSLPCSTHPTLHIPLVKSGCALCHHHLIPPNHSSWTKNASAWLQTSPEVDFFKEKPHQEITTAVMADFKVSNELDGVVGCQCKTSDCSVGHRQWNALFSSSQLCSYQFHLSLVPSSVSQCSGCDTHDPLSRVGPQRVTQQAVWGESDPLITAFRGCAIYHRMESSHHTPFSLLTGFSVQVWQDRPESSYH